MKGRDRKGVRRGKVGRKHRQTQAGRDSDPEENRKRWRTRREERRKPHSPRLAGACVLRLCKNSVFC